MTQADFRSAQPAEADEIVTLVAEVFQGSKEHYHNLLHGDPMLDLNHIQVALADGRIVSTVWVIPRDVRWCGGSMTLGGIGNVVTHPDYRGRGYATRLMADAMGFMRERGYPLALLRTEIPDYYARLGWEVWSEQWWRIPIDADLPGGDGKYRVRSFRSRDLDSVIDLYERFSESFNGTVIRSSAYWEAHFSWIGNEIDEDPDAFLIAEHDHELTGYVRATRKGHVAEIAWEPDTVTPWKLLSAVIQHGRRNSWEAITLPVLPGLDFDRLGERASASTTLDLMLQPVHLESLMRASGLDPSKVDWLDVVKEKGFHYWMTDYF